MSNIRQHAKRPDIDGVQYIPGRSIDRVVGSRLANAAVRCTENPARPF